ncbi:MAG: alpha-L-rhamnosidase [Lentisphaerae bacterium]|nr:alpha-L-rhamnosidase [Lentisphaerota bacterium]
MSGSTNHDGMRRRDLLKMSLASAGALGVGEAAGAADGVSAAGAPGAIPEGRKRPACLDLAWAKGTGLIWMAGECVFFENPRNRFMRFRRAFDVAAPPRRAELRLFADTHYIAWLNGVEVGRGPGRSDTTWALFDTYDVAALLKPGRNVLAVLALFHGFGTGGRRSVMQALLAHLEMESADGKRSHVVSDRSWKASPADEFVRPSPRLHATLGCAEVQDLRRADEGWHLPGHDDAAWAASDYTKPSLTNTPWYHFAPEPLPARTLTDHPFPRAVRSIDVAMPLPPVDELGSVRPAAPGGTESVFPVRVDGGAAARVVTLDLGRTEAGYLAIDVTGPAGAVIDVLCTELLVDGRVPIPGNARVHTNRFILRDGRQTLRTAFNWIAFRFAQLWIWTPGPLEIRDATLRRLELPMGPAGHFRCSDDFLNRLDGICEHTLRLCSQDGILDSSSREQQQWIGDGRFTAVTLQHRFNAAVLHRRLIDQVGQGIDWAGSMVPRFPTGNVNVSPIPLYALQWVLAFGDYGRFTGDTSLVAEWRTQIPHVLRWFTAFERADGLLERVPHWMYIDLGEAHPGRIPSVGAVNTTLNLYYLAALRFASAALGASDPATAGLAARATRLEAAIRAVLWDDAAGAYRDSLEAAGRFGTLSEGANANALVHLEAPGSPRAVRIIESVFAKPQGDPIRASPFMMNAVFEALGRHGRADLVFPMLKARYAEQVESGTTWEHWKSHSRGGDKVPNGHSLSHAWGAGALAFFLRDVAGLQPAAPGWRAVRVAPQPGPLTRAEASIETVAGRVFAAWTIESGVFRLRVELPPGIGGVARLPDGTEAAVPPGGGEFRCPMARAG